MTAFKRILVPQDFSDDASAALDFAIELAKQLGGELHLLHAYRPPIEVFSPYGVAIPDAVMPELRQAAERQLKELAARVEAAGLTAQVHLREGAAAEVIAESARELGVDLIVMGTRGRTGLAHVVLGSVAERTVRSAPCPVLTLRS